MSLLMERDDGGCTVEMEKTSFAYSVEDNTTTKLKGETMIQ